MNDMEANRTRKQPLTFRQEEVGRVMERWRAADSCSLIGVGSVGKSNLLQHLADPRVQAEYMDIVKANRFKAIIIDPSLLGPLPNRGSNMEQIRCWSGYELMMHRLFLAFHPLVDSLGEQQAEEFLETYQKMQDGNDPLYAYMGLRYFELGLEFFMRAGIQIVFMFDEFEELMAQMPVKFFQTLRGLRDNNKRRLSYLTFSRAPIPDIAEQCGKQQLDIEPFAELFTDSMIYVGPYNETDARDMLQSLIARNKKQVDEYTINFLLWATGRYAGLLRSGFRSLDTIGPLDANKVMTMGEQIVYQLALKRPVRTECRTIWTSLSDDERAMLREFTNPKPNIDPNNLEVQQIFALLQQKKLLKIDDNRVTIEPPVFYSFVTNDPDADV
jgi:hypothetical protein